MLDAEIAFDSAYQLPIRRPTKGNPRREVDIDAIVGVKGDVRRGQKPFPHPFPARMPIEVAQAAVLQLTRPGDVILDPMCGSGVTLRAATTLERDAIGIDVDPLAIMQAKALCSRPDPTALTTAANALLVEAQAIRENQGTDRLWSTLNEEDRKFLQYWFEDGHADELYALSLALDRLEDSPLRPVLGTLVSSLIISRGSGASRALDLSRSRPHRVEAKRPARPFDHWRNKVAAFARHYADQEVRAGQAKIVAGDARELDVDDDTVDAIITSPPYVNAIDYMRISKFALIFFGERLSDLRRIRSGSIGSEVGLRQGLLPPALDQMVDDHVTDAKRRPLLRRYLSDLRSTLAESQRVLKPGGLALYVMGPSILSRRDYDAARVLQAVAETVGLRPVSHGRRDLARKIHCEVAGVA